MTDHIEFCAGCDKLIDPADDTIEVGEPADDARPVLAHTECAELVNEKIREAGR